MPEVNRFFKKKYVRLAARVLLVCLTFDCPVVFPSQAVPGETAPSFPVRIILPPDAGYIDTFHQGTSGKTVIYIQDAHDSLEAQENIARIIDHFVERSGVRLVYEEGYEGRVPTDSFFGFIDDPELKRAVSHELMDRLRIGGAEFAHINRLRDFVLIGADSLDFHLEAVQAYARHIQGQEEIRRDLRGLEQELSNAADRVLPPELKEWLRLKKRYEEEKLPFDGYLERLVSAAEISGKNLSEDFPLISRLQTSETVSDAFDPAEFSGITAEIEALEKRLVSSRTAGEAEALIDTLRAVRLLERLNALSITSSGYKEARLILENMDTRRLIQYAAQGRTKGLFLSRGWEKMIAAAVHFYETALLREEKIGLALDTFMKSGESSAVLVYGGFHRAGIEAMLRERDLSYAVVSPLLTEADPKHRELYKRAMADPGLNTHESSASRSLAVFETAVHAGEEAVRSEIGKVYEKLSAGKAAPPYPRSELRTGEEEKKGGRLSKEAFLRRLLEIEKEAAAKGERISRSEFTRRMGGGNWRALRVRAEREGFSTRRLSRFVQVITRKKKDEEEDSAKERFESGLRLAVSQAKKELGIEGSTEGLAPDAQRVYLDRVAEIMGHSKRHNFKNRAGKLGVDLQTFDLHFPGREALPDKTSEARRWLKANIPETSEEKRKLIVMIFFMAENGMLQRTAAYTLIKAVQTGKTGFKELDIPAARILKIKPGSVSNVLAGKAGTDPEKKPSLFDFLAAAADKKAAFEEERRGRPNEHQTTLPLRNKFFFPYALESLFLETGSAEPAALWLSEALKRIPDGTLSREQSRLLHAIVKNKSVLYGDLGNVFRPQKNMLFIKDTLFGPPGEAERKGAYDALKDAVLSDAVLRTSFEELTAAAGIETARFTPGFFQWLHSRGHLGPAETGNLSRLLIYDPANVPVISGMKDLSIESRRRLLEAYLSGSSLAGISRALPLLITQPSSETQKLSPEALERWLGGISARKDEGAAGRLRIKIQEDGTGGFPVQETHGRAALSLLEGKITDEELLRFIERLTDQKSRLSRLFRIAVDSLEARGGDETLPLFRMLLYRASQDRELDLDSPSVLREIILTWLSKRGDPEFGGRFIKTFLESARSARPLYSRTEIYGAFWKIARITAEVLRREERERAAPRPAAVKKESEAKKFSRLADKALEEHLNGGLSPLEEGIEKELDRMMQILADAVKGEGPFSEGLFDYVYERVYAPVQILEDAEAESPRMYHRPSTFLYVRASQKFDLEKAARLREEHRRRLRQAERIFLEFWGSRGAPGFWPEDKIKLYIWKHHRSIVRAVSFNERGKEYIFNPEGVDMDDLLAIARASLMKAAYRYDAPDYASSYLRLEDGAAERLKTIEILRRELEETRGKIEAIRSSEAGEEGEVSNDLVYRKAYLEKALSMHEAHHGGNGERAQEIQKELAADLKESERSLVKAMFVIYFRNFIKSPYRLREFTAGDLRREILSLDETLSGEDEGMTRGDTVTGHGREESVLPDILKSMETRELKAQAIDSLHSGTDSLAQRDRALLRLSLGADPLYPRLTLADTAYALAFQGFPLVTRERVRQITERDAPLVREKMIEISQKENLRQWEEAIEAIHHGKDIDIPPPIIAPVKEPGNITIGSFIRIGGLKKYAGETVSVSLMDHELLPAHAPRGAARQGPAAALTLAVREPAKNFRRAGVFILHIQKRPDGTLTQIPAGMRNGQFVFQLRLDEEGEKDDFERSELRRTAPGNDPLLVIADFREMVRPGDGEAYTLEQIAETLSIHTLSENTELFIHDADPALDPPLYRDLQDLVTGIVRRFPRLKGKIRLLKTTRSELLRGIRGRSGPVIYLFKRDDGVLSEAARLGLADKLIIYRYEQDGGLTGEAGTLGAAVETAERVAELLKEKDAALLKENLPEGIKKHPRRLYFYAGPERTGKWRDVYDQAAVFVFARSA